MACRSDDMDGLCEFVAVARVSFFFCFLGMPTGRIGGPILTNYASYDVFPLKDPKYVPYGGCVDIAPNYGVISPKSQFWGCE